MSYVDIVFDGPPGQESGRFVEVEDPNSKSVRFGKWIDLGEGHWALRIPNHEEEITALRAQVKNLQQELRGWANPRPVRKEAPARGFRS